MAEPGTISIIGETVVFPEKALPTQARLVVYENQKRRKYQLLATYTI